ncbi:2-aminoethanethiol dioxygenase [Plakobranchus ocellatus]|uniref:2-aminoethanethiol dioxygenase n=1 Tax=Plakobranchus ocellatus TaxID=259542 RepID=A0AAV4BZE9_9GAST|nr:2-aminoethanethiol dioxygenase [Plakobranchus ocellatus]
MASPIQRLAKLSYKIFGGQSNDMMTKETLKPLISALNEIKAMDLQFDPVEVIERDEVLRTHGDVAPVTFMSIHQSQHFTMAVFIVKAGGFLPLHDHPGMFGLLKVISGSVKLTSYTQTDTRPLPQCSPQRPVDLPKNILTVKKNIDTIVTESDDCCCLSPLEKNFHKIEALTDVAAFLDILAPPYGGERDCNYYKELPIESPHHKDVRWLAEVPQPRSYWCDVLKYKGPSLTSINTMNDL